VKILVIADDDSAVQSLIPECADILIACGDLADSTILKAAELSQCAHIFAVKGNHDSATAFPLPITDLHFNVEHYSGLKLGGFNGSWKYKPRGHFLYEQSEVERMLLSFPSVDVFVAHNSPLGVHDKEDEVHTGFEAFIHYIHRTKPKLFLHGHQHVSIETQIGETRVIGVYGCKRLELAKY
jgi:uncharacterized protein